MFVIKDISDLLVELQNCIKERHIINLLSRINTRLLDAEKAGVVIDQLFLVLLKETITLHILKYEKRKVEFNSINLAKINRNDISEGKRKTEHFKKLIFEHDTDEKNLKNDLEQYNFELEKRIKQHSSY